MEEYRQLIGLLGLIIESVGVLVIVLGSMYSGWRYLSGRQESTKRSYQQLRGDLGRSILLGLEFFIAGDIIRTVSVEPSLENVSLLGLIVVIRTFLSITLHMEVEGRWPWQEAFSSERRDSED